MKRLCGADAPVRQLCAPKVAPQFSVRQQADRVSALHLRHRKRKPCRCNSLMHIIIRVSRAHECRFKLRGRQINPILEHRAEKSVRRLRCLTRRQKRNP